jgi:hypothetical protein
MEASRFIRHTTYHELPEDEMLQRATEFAAFAHTRRTVCQFSARPVPREVIEQCLYAAGSAPSAGNTQPWRFVAISDWRTKFAIRRGAEQAERDFYGGEAPRRRGDVERCSTPCPAQNDQGEKGDPPGALSRRPSIACGTRGMQAARSARADGA